MRDNCLLGRGVLSSAPYAGLDTRVSQSEVWPFPCLRNMIHITIADATVFEKSLTCRMQSRPFPEIEFACARFMHQVDRADALACKGLAAAHMITFTCRYKSSRARAAKKEIGIKPMKFPRYSPDLMPLDFSIWKAIEARMALEIYLALLDLGVVEYCKVHTNLT